MNVEIKEILLLLSERGYEYTFIGDDTRKILGFSDPASYRVGTAIWLGATKYLKLTQGMTFSDVSLLFCAPDMKDAENFPNRILCKDPRNTFMELVEIFAETKKEATIASTAVISPKAILGKNVTVGHFAVIEDDVVIGDNTYVADAVTIHKGCIIGKNCAIYDHTAIGVPGYGFRTLENGTHKRLPHIGGVVIEDDVELGAFCVVDRGTFKDTKIGNGTKIDAKSYIAHNVEIGEQSMLMSSCIISGNCRIGAHTELIGVRCKNRINIGDRVKIGIGSVVLFDVPDDAKVFGYPAKKMPF